MLTNTLLRDVSNRLPHINEVLPYNEGDLSLMKDIKQVLANHNALNRFGVVLLHDHFSLQENEVLVETEDVENRTLTVRPIRIAQITDESAVIMETQWRFDDPESIATPMQRCVKSIGSRHTVEV